MHALRALTGLAGIALLLAALAPSASAYTCTPVGQNGSACDINDDGVPDFYQVFVPGLSTGAVVYRDASVVSTGFYYVIYGQFGFHTGGAGAGCYDPQQDLDCDYGSVYFGSNDVGYLDLQKYGDSVRLCRYGIAGYTCTTLL